MKNPYRYPKPSDKRYTVGGYALIWNQLPHHQEEGCVSLPFNLADKKLNQKDIVRKGAFQESLKDGHQFALLNHDADQHVGYTGDGTMRIKEDAIGLYFEVDILDEGIGRQILTDFHYEGFLRVSASYRLEEWKSIHRSGGDVNIIRTITKARLREISILTPGVHPKHTLTRVMPKHLDKYQEFRNGIEGMRHAINRLPKIYK